MKIQALSFRRRRKIDVNFQQPFSINARIQLMSLIVKYSLALHFQHVSPISSRLSRICAISPGFTLCLI